MRFLLLAGFAAFSLGWAGCGSTASNGPGTDGGDDLGDVGTEDAIDDSSFVDSGAPPDARDSATAPDTTSPDTLTIDSNVAADSGAVDSDFESGSDGGADADAIVDTGPPLPTPTGTTQWGFQLPAGAEAVAVDPSGNTIVVGKFRGTFDFGGTSATSKGNDDAFILSLRADGTLKWLRTFGSATGDGFHDVIATLSGDVFAAGYYTGQVDFGSGLRTSTSGYDAVVVKFDLDGNTVWAQQYLGGTSVSAEDEEIWRLAPMPDGGVAIMGTVSQRLELGGGVRALSSGLSDNKFVARVDANGIGVWAYPITGGNWPNYNAPFVADRSGNIALGSTYFSAMSFQKTATTTVSLAHSYTYSGGDVFVVVFDPNGLARWVKAFATKHPTGGGDDNTLLGMNFDRAGNLGLTGQHGWVIDFGGGPLGDATTLAPQHFNYVAKLTAAGGHVFSKDFGVGAVGIGIDFDPTGGVVLGGTFPWRITFGGPLLDNPSSNGFVYTARLTDTLGYVWTRQIGQSNSHASATDFAMGNDGSGAVLGYAQAPITLGSTTIPAPTLSSFNYWVARFAR